MIRPRSKAVVLFVSLAIAGFLPGCGGGGGGGDSGPADTVRPAVLGSTPADNAAGVPLDSIITGLMSEDIDPASVNQNSLRVMRAGLPVDGTTILAPDGSTLQFTPTAALARMTPHEVALAGDVTDLAGNSLGADFTWDFATGRFEPAVLLTSGENSGLPQDGPPNLVTGPDGLSRYALKDFAPGGEGVRVYRHEPGAGWIVDLTPPGTSSSFPALGVDGAGRVLMMYTRLGSVSGTQELVAHPRDPVGGWQSAPDVVATTTNSILEPDVVVTPGGHAAVLWREITGPGNDSVLKSAIYNGTAWSTPETLPNYSDSIGASHKWPVRGSIAIDETTGKASARWAEVDHRCCSFLGWSDVIARYTPGSGWDAFIPTLGSDPIGNSQPDHAPVVEILPGGATSLSVRMSYRMADMQAHPIGALYDLDSNTLTPPPDYLDGYSPISPDPDVPEYARDPRSAMDASGNVLLLWSTNDNRQPLNAAVVSRLYMPGVGYEPLLAVAPPISGTITEPVLAGAPDGTAVAAWLVWDGTTESVYATRRAPGQNWEPVQRVAFVDHSGLRGLAASINANGVGHITWENQVPGPSLPFTVHASRFE